MRSSRLRALTLCLVLLVFAQACVGPAPPASSPPVPTLVVIQPVTTSAAESPTPVPTSQALLQPTPTRLPTSPTPTEPRLGINPPGTASPPRGSTPVTPPVAGSPATIMEIQGVGAKSPLLARTVRVSGLVTATFQQAPAQGFFLQDPQGDGNPATADGIFVFQGDRATPPVKVGDAVTVVGVVRELTGRTTLDISLAGSAVWITASGNRLPEPVELQPPRDNTAAQVYYERLEGMLVRVPTAVVVGPTSRYGEFTVVRADSGLKRVFQNDPRGTGERIVVDDAGGREAHYDVTVGATVTGLIGPLDYTFGQYKLEQLPEVKLQVIAPAPASPAFAPARPGEFTVASFNLENFFDTVDTPGTLDPCDVDQNGNPCQERVTPADYQRKLTKSAAAIRDVLGAPTLVAVQEVESLDVLNALAARPELAPFGYGAVLLPGLDPRGINVGLLYRKDQVTVVNATQRNLCTAEKLGFSDVEARCSTKNNGVLDGFWLAARPPLVVDLVVRSGGATRTLTAIVNHFKAKSGNDPAGQQFVARREAEARLVAGIVNEIVARDANAAVLVLGDLNDFVDSTPLRVLMAAAPLHDLALDVPPAERYSYIFNGESEVLDHILVTPALRPALLAAGFAHCDADYPVSRAQDMTPYRVSDHDPPVARFTLAP